MNILLTGASSGIGHELSKFLLDQDYFVCGIARRKIPDDLKKYVEAGKFLYIEHDLSSPDNLSELKNLLKKNNFNPDVIILNAGQYIDDLKDDFNFNNAVVSLRVNTIGPLGLLNLFLEDFLSRGFGRVIAISSIAAFRPNYYSLGYSMSKAALTMAMRSLRLRYGSQGIDFSTVFLGPIATPMTKSFWLNDKNEPKIFFVKRAVSAARFIAAVIPKKGLNYYYPLSFIIIFRLINFFPDSWYSAIAQFFKK